MIAVGAICNQFHFYESTTAIADALVWRSPSGSPRLNSTHPLPVKELFYLGFP